MENGRLFKVRGMACFGYSAGQSPFPRAGCLRGNSRDLYGPGPACYIQRIFMGSVVKKLQIGVW